MEARREWMAAPAAPVEGFLARTVRRGDPFVWLTGGALALSLLMIAGILLLIAARGFLALWPPRLEEFRFADGTVMLGAVREIESSAAAPDGAPRMLLRRGNRDVYGSDFEWVSTGGLIETTRPEDAWWIERREWGPFFGTVESLRLDGRSLTGPEAAAAFPEAIKAAGRRVAAMTRVETGEIGRINRGIESDRFAIRKVEIRGRADTPAGRKRTAALQAEIETAQEEYARAAERLSALRREDARHTVTLKTAEGTTREIPLSGVVGAYHPNALGLPGRVGVFLGNVWEFVSADPRESNTEGGVFPAIFGTVMMTLIMTIAVVPFGVLGALYLREYARQGPIVSAIRVAVNNLAGVPSIVFGVFGLGFFVYTIGGSIDQIFYPERLPNPTFGGGGILWASLTLAILTVPVVIVSTEEALAAVPSGMREGSVACGASKFQTLARIVLPSAAPGIMTGAILAMARGAGEVAPLMLTGVVKLAPALPVDGQFPFVHLERRFMHLGFHIYDVGFQSPNVEAAKPMVYATAFLLIAVVVALNLTAIVVRNRLRRKYRGGE